MAARIVALADVYDALTSARVYKSASDPEVSRSMIENEAGKHFDPAIIDAFRERFADLVQVRKRCGVEEAYPVPIETAGRTKIEQVVM